METALVIAGVLVVLAAAGGWWLSRRHRQVVGDDEFAWPSPAAPPEAAGPPPLLDRDALLQGRRPFNPAGWDDTPDDDPGASDDSDVVPDAGGEDLPTYFDRDFLAGRQRPEPPES
nr:hypothetical protein [Propionicimonas sp.]